MAKQALSIPKLIELVPDEESAYRFLDGLRWPDGPVCAHCGHDKAYFLTPKSTAGRASGAKKNSRSTRRLFKCAKCRKQFSVLTNTIMHGTHISIRTWVFVLYEMSASKNGCSARELSRKYEITDEAAWFMTMRIREAMKREPMVAKLTGEVEVDETYYGGRVKGKYGLAAVAEKTPIVTLISRETGEARSQMMERVTSDSLQRVVRDHVSPDAVLMTDGHKGYLRVGAEQAEHHSVNHHIGQYARTTYNGRRAGINSAEGYFGQLKRSIEGTHHFVSTEHLNRYLTEFDYRYSTRKMSDADRMTRLVGQAGGRRLTYRPLTGD
jgi:transposase-like protein